MGVGGFGESVSRPNNVFVILFSFFFSLFISCKMSLAPVLTFTLTCSSLHHYSLLVGTVKRSVHPISTDS